MLSARKAEKEGHAADSVAKALSRVVRGSCFRRRREKGLESVPVRKMLNRVFEELGEEALNGCVFTANRGYGKESFSALISSFSQSCIFVMPEKIL